MDDESPAPLVPEEKDPGPTGIERIRAKEAMHNNLYKSDW